MVVTVMLMAIGYSNFQVIVFCNWLLVSCNYHNTETTYSCMKNNNIRIMYIHYFSQIKPGQVEEVLWYYCVSQVYRILKSELRSDYKSDRLMKAYRLSSIIALGWLCIGLNS